jgi:hypothetical protein
VHRYAAGLANCGVLADSDQFTSLPSFSISRRLARRHLAKGVFMTSEYSGSAVGWSAFAGIMLVVMGVFDIIQGIVALFNDEFFVLTSEYVFKFDITTWGWIHLAGGVVLVLSGIGIFSGNVAARTVGVIVAGLAVVWNFAWLPYYPIWSIIAIAIAVTVIWALTVHGRDIAEDR